MIRAHKIIKRFVSPSVSVIRCGSSLKASNQYCRELVRTSDYQNYLIGLLFPGDCQDAFFAIRAFNVEIAMIKDHIPRNTFQAGRLRFQFWKDLLQDIYFGNGSLLSQHPSGMAIFDAVKEKNLTLRWFERSLEARYKDMANDHLFETMDDLETYAEMGHSSILYLVLEILNIRNNNDAEFAASHIGVCSGILTLLQGQLHHASKVCVFRCVCPTYR